MQASDTDSHHDNIFLNVPDDKMEDFVKSIIKREGFVAYKCDMKNITSKGGSYMGTLHEYKLTGKTDYGDDKEINIFVKKIITASEAMIFSIPEAYRRENFMYQELAKVYYELQEEAKVPLEERFTTAKAFDECNPKMVILENLTEKGYKTYYRMDAVKLEYAELVVQKLAQYHGVSFALENKRPEYFEEKVKPLECIYSFDKVWEGFTKSMCTISLDVLDDNTKEKYGPSIEAIVEKYSSYMTDKFCVRALCHGDYRHNNIMVKEINGLPVEVLVLDYQIIHIGNPVLDFLYFIFWGTDQQFRTKHLHYLKELYHRHLSSFLNYFDIDVEHIFSKKEFERQFEEKLDFGLMVAVLYLPFLFPPDVDVPDVTDGSNSVENIQIGLDDKYRVRFTGIVEDFIQWGYL